MRVSVPSIILVALAITCSVSCGSSSTAPSGTMTDTFSGLLQKGGVDYQNFTVTVAGPFTATLTSLASGSPAIGFGVGIPTTSARGCYLTMSTSTSMPGSQLAVSSSVDPGTYCVAIFDQGSLTAALPFTVSIEHS